MQSGDDMKRLLVSVQAAFVILLATSFVVAAPSFKDRMTAKKLGAEAKQLAQRGKHEKAAKKYSKADKLVPAPSYKLALAKVLLELEDLVQASEVLEECMDQSPVRQWGEKNAQKKCIELASEVDDKMPRLAVVVIEPSSEDVIIQIDGEDYDPSEGEIGYNPGKFKITAEAEGYEDYTKKVRLEEGDRTTIEITLKGGVDEDDEEEETEEDSGGLSPIPAYIAWGLGAAGVGVGIGFGIAAIQTTNKVLADYGCENGQCSAEAENDLNIAKPLPPRGHRRRR
jgi:tetratricopeptide (TPR) repeat protein